MMTNEEFLETIRESFKAYLNVGTSRSPEKLHSLHGNIAKDLESVFGNDFTIKSKGYSDNKEIKVSGRYYQKNVDITLLKNNKPIAGYALKFVVRNYSQNANNYFEGMLGETANLRSNSIPYFQVFVVFDKLPYYLKNGKFKKYEEITQHYMEKYLALSKDDPNLFYHTPDKTLFVLVSLKEKSYDYKFVDSTDYADYYRSVINDADLMCYSTKIKDPFDDSVIYNDYEDFLQRTYHIIMGRLKKA